LPKYAERASQAVGKHSRTKVHSTVNSAAVYTLFLIPDKNELQKQQQLKQHIFEYKIRD
jgi:helix-turn-helix protein